MKNLAGSNPAMRAGFFFQWRLLFEMAVENILIPNTRNFIYIMIENKYVTLNEI
jgi:hypothetical protein